MGCRSARRTIGWKTARIAPGASSSRKSSTARVAGAWEDMRSAIASGIGPRWSNLRRPGRLSGAPARLAPRGVRAARGDHPQALAGRAVEARHALHDPVDVLALEHLV